MVGNLFVFGLLTYICVSALVRPWIGVVGYYGFVLLMPEWNWRWSVPRDFPYQKYIALATLLGFLISGLRSNRWDAKTTVSCGCLLVFLALAYLSSFFSIAPQESAFYLDSLWKIVLMGIVGICVLDTPRRIHICLWAAVLAQGYNAFRINESYFEIGRCIFAMYPWGFYTGDNNVYSILTIPLIAASASLMFCSQRLWQKLLAGFILMLQVHQVMLMESRGGMLGGLCMAPLMLWFMPKTRLNLAAVAVAILGGAVLAGPPVIKEFTSSFKKEGERDSSAESRFDLWKAGWAITKDYPILGVGPNCGPYMVPRYLWGGGGIKALHNLFFEISTGCGVPALTFYLTFFLLPWLAAFWKLSFRRGRPPDWAYATFMTLACGLVGYFVSSMFSSGARLESSYLMVVLALSSFLVLEQERRKELRESEYAVDDEGEFSDAELAEAAPFQA